MHESRDAYPELVYAIAASRVRAMHNEETVRQLRRARRHRRFRRVRAAFRAVSMRR